MGYGMCHPVAATVTIIHAAAMLLPQSHSQQVAGTACVELQYLQPEVAPAGAEGACATAAMRTDP